MRKASMAPSARDGAADVEEIGRLGAVKLDDVHGGHGQAGAVDQAADVAVEGDVVEAGLLGADVEGALLGFVGEGGEVGVAESGVVVEVELGVDGQQLAVPGDHQRIDLRERGIHLDEGLGEVEHELGGLGGELVLEAELVGQFAGLEGLQPQQRMEGFLEHFFGGFLGDFFDFHAALGGGDHRGRAAGAVDGDAE